MNPEISEYTGDFATILPLLLMGDESEAMIAGYISDCRIYVAEEEREGRIIAVCAVMRHAAGHIEVKNLAVSPQFRKRGIGRRMLRYVESLNPSCLIEIGTGETPSTLRFYQSCGYRPRRVIPNFFTDNYPTPIIEEGVRLRDMIYLAKTTAGRD